MRYKILISFIILSIFFGFNVNAQTNNDCMLCHEDKDLTTIKSGKRISVYVNIGLYRKSVHKNLKCIDCHKDAAVDFPHPERLKKVNCGSCHKEAMKMFESGLHGQAFKRRGDVCT
jgi:nitrate/TMAO reductase-like tetraheme cytochrome c subunit